MTVGQEDHQEVPFGRGPRRPEQDQYLIAIHLPNAG